MNHIKACPICGSDVRILQSTDHSYGADADGNRGRMMIDVETDQDCDCELSDDQVDAMTEDLESDDDYEPDEDQDRRWGIL